ISSKYFFKIGDNNYLVQTLREFLYSRFYLTTPANKVCSTVFDYSMQSMLAEYRKFNGLNGQNNIFVTGTILDKETYEQIGTEMTELEIELAAVHDVVVKKLLYGDPCKEWETIAPVIAKDKFIGWGHKGIKENCF